MHYYYEVVCTKKKSTVHQVSAEASMNTIDIYTNEDGIVTYTPMQQICMVSTVSLIYVIDDGDDDDDDDDDDETPEYIFISVPIGDEHRQGKKDNVKIDTGAGRNIISIKHSKNYLVKM